MQQQNTNYSHKNEKTNYSQIFNKTCNIVRSEDIGYN